MIRNNFTAPNMPMIQSLPPLQGMAMGIAPPTEGANKDFKWGNIGDVVDTKEAAKKLQQLGLVGADQILESQPNIKDENSIKSNQGDWKITAVQHIMANAKRLGISKPEELEANMDVLTNTLDPKYRAALKDPSFAVTHPNFNQILKSILKEESGKSEKQNSIAKK